MKFVDVVNCFNVLSIILFFKPESTRLTLVIITIDIIMDIILIILSFCVRKITPIVVINKYKNADLSPDKKTSVSKTIILKIDLLCIFR